MSSKPFNDPQPWTVLESEHLSRRPWLTVRRDRVQLPHGSIIDEYYVLEYPDWVNVIAVTKDDQLVMVRQYRHGIGRVSYELPAGVVDGTDPDLEFAARRELREETGYGGGVWKKWMSCSANPSTHNNLAHSFLAVGVERLGEAEPEAAEDLRTVLVPVVRLMELVEAGEILQAMNLAPLLKYLLERR